MFGRDGGWNVSIRRRRRHEGREEEALAEQETEETSQIPAPLPTLSEVVEAAVAEEEAVLGLDTGRTASIRSSRSHGSSSVAPRPLTGEVSRYSTPSSQCPKIQPIRTGNLLYLNVHDEDAAPFYEWIQTDARLYAEGLQLIWRTAAGAQAMVTLDLEYCEEVASTSSPNNPAARDDLGTMAAQRQSNLADNLYPFKLVYDDGTERLGCDSARERGKYIHLSAGRNLTSSSMGQCYLECSRKNKR